MEANENSQPFGPNIIFLTLIIMVQLCHTKCMLVNKFLQKRGGISDL